MIYALLSQNFDVRIYALFRRFLETENWTPQTFSLLECMRPGNDRLLKIIPQIKDGNMTQPENEVNK